MTANLLANKGAPLFNRDAMKDTSSIRPLPSISTAFELTRNAERKLANISHFRTSLSGFGDIQTHRNLRATIMREVRRTRRYLSARIYDYAVLAYSFALAIH